MLYTNLINLADTALHNSPYLLSIVIYMLTVNPTFIHVQDVFERVARALLLQIFLAANLSFDSDHNMGLDKAWLQKLSHREPVYLQEIAK